MSFGGGGGGGSKFVEGTMEGEEVRRRLGVISRILKIVGGSWISGVDLEFLEVDLEFLWEDLETLRVDLDFLWVHLECLEVDLEILGVDLETRVVDLEFLWVDLSIQVGEGRYPHAWGHGSRW